MASPQEDDELGRGQTVGRYVVTGRLGRGAMGSVHAAYDPELTRRVALKVLRPRAIERQGQAQAHQRLLREAQALARLSHPHVVRVFDVGTDHGRVFLAMELVDGQSLRQWLREPRGWRAVVERMEQAGRGLQAAHALDLVHRDFKPDNVLISSDGRVRVGDFGLARWVGRPGTDPDDDPDSDPGTTEGGDWSPQLTAAGDALGTPAYMAPEQHAGHGADARSDQYAFCVTLFEALYGRWPWEAADGPGFEHAKRSGGSVDGGPKGAAGSVPQALRAVIRRGLAVEPDARFEDMGALLQAMARVRDRGSRRIVVVGLGLAALGGAGLWMAPREGATRCAGAGQPPPGGWTEDRRGALRKRLGQHLSPDAVTRDLGALQRWVDAWSASHREACEDTWVRGEQSAERLGARTECLRRQWPQFEETVALLGEADARTAGRSAELVLGLPPPGACDRPPHGRGVARADESEREATVRALARVAVLRRAARPEQAWAELRAWIPEADTATTAEAAARTLARGRLLEDRGEVERGAQAYRQALREAKVAGDARAEAEAWLHLASLTAEFARDPRRARFEVQMGQAAAEAAGGDDRIESRAQTLLGSLAAAAGDGAAARVHAERALELRRTLYGDLHPLTASSRAELGEVLRGQGRLDEAVQQLRRAHQIRQVLYGPEHPTVAASAARVEAVLQKSAARRESMPTTDD